MRRPQAFIPAAGEALEPRTVPTGLGGFLGSLPVQDAFAVRRDFDAFARTYVNDVRTFLAPATGTPNPTGFNTAIYGMGGAIDKLNAAIAADVKNLKAGPGFATTIAGQITTLESTLMGLTPPANSRFSTVLAYDRKALQAIEATENSAAKLVASDAPTGLIDSTTVNTLLRTVRTAFTTFNKAYYAAEKADLLISTPNTTQFTTDVTSALTTLNSTIVAALPSALPTLATTITNDLLSPATGTDTSLQHALSKITPPTSSGFSRLIFNLKSAFDASVAYARVNHDIVNAIQTYNNGLY